MKMARKYIAMQQRHGTSTTHYKPQTKKMRDSINTYACLHRSLQLLVNL